MVTGLLGPQAETDVFVNWQRGHHTSGEDPFLNGVMSAAPVLYPFGYGLSYTTFGFSALKLEENKDTSVDVKFQVRNTAARGQERSSHKCM